ncbi:MAG: fluoride efflux transporter CrcB [Chloroflexota bacterium]
MTFLAISIGAILGANLRYLVGAWIAARTPGTFPWATIAINVAGSFALGLVLALTMERELGPWWVRPAVGIGFLGSFTTFSAFSAETVALLEQGDATGALLNVALSVGVCVAGAALGLAVGRAL